MDLFNATLKGKPELQVPESKELGEILGSTRDEVSGQFGLIYKEKMIYTDYLVLG
jgi:hypothetical protein